MNFNPFDLPGVSELVEITRQRRERAESELRVKQAASAYKELIADPRYKAIQQELSRTLGEQLDLLVRTASKCAHCAPHAERVRLLHEVIDSPSQIVWHALHDERLQLEAVQQAESIAESLS